MAAFKKKFPERLREIRAGLDDGAQVEVSRISANLADKARRMGIPVWRFSEEGGA